MVRTLIFLCLAVSAASEVSAQCGEPASQDGVSREALDIIARAELRKVEANAEIDHETAQELLGRLFDLETGELKTLPLQQEAQYQRDAKYFSTKLRKEADEANARAKATLKKIVPCPAR